MLIFRATRSSSIKSTLRTTQQLLNFSSDDKKSPPPSPIPTNNDENGGEKSSEKSIEQNEKLSTADRLNKLLTSMQTDDHLTIGKKIEIPIAGGGKKKKEKLKALEKEKKEKIEKSEDIIVAAKNVANMIEGDAEQKKETESELLAKLLNHINSGAGSAVKDDNKKDLGDMSLNDLIVGMKIDRQKKSTNDTRTDYQISRSQFVRNVLDNQRPSRDENYKKFQDRRKKLTEPPQFTGSVNLFGSEPLGIFTKPNELRNQTDLLPTWTLLHEKELKLIGTRPAKNYFEKIVKWTDDNKVWNFPIDNEQGMETEANVDFSEHVFLEQHLEGWCPDKGPIRHFMELVCVGLSKNPYITANEKKEHILWYRDYFDKKKDVLKDLIAATKTAEPNKMENKQNNLTSS